MRPVTDLKSDRSRKRIGGGTYALRHKNVQISPQDTRDRNPFLGMGDSQVIGN